MTKKISNLLKSANAQKNFKIMKLVALFLTIGMSISYAGNSYSQVTTLNLKLKNKTVREVFNEIEKNSEYVFLYNRETLDPERVVSINAKKETISDVLDKLFEGTDNTYKVSDRQVYISKAERQQQTVIIAEPEQQQKKQITGIVTDTEDIPIIGANIIEIGTTNGTITDIDGRFVLSVENEAILRITYIGYLEQEVSVKDKLTLSIILQEDISALDELIVVGYGVQKRSDITGSVQRVDAANFSTQLTTNMLEMLNGTVAGFSSNQGTGASGGGSMEIRGTTSIAADSNPLIVLDGVIYNGSIGDINPNDIESIDILKDASSAAIFGARSASGVLIVTTKRGSTSKPKINFSLKIGAVGVTNEIKPLNPQQYVQSRADFYNISNLDKPDYYYSDPYNLPGGLTLEEWKNFDSIPSDDPVEMWLNRLGMNNIEINNYKNGKTVNWYDLVMRNGVRQDYNVNVSGGSQSLRYFWSLDYTDNKGIIMGDDYRNVRSRVNLDSDITNFLNVGVNVQFADRNQSSQNANLNWAITASPYGNIFEEDEKTFTFYPHGDQLYLNPLLYYSLRDKLDVTQSLFTTLYGEVKFPYDISYKVSFTNRYSWQKNYHFDPITTPIGFAAQGYGRRIDESVYEWQIDNVLTWTKSIAEIHHINATFLLNAEKYQSWNSIQENSQFSPSGVLSFHALQAGISPSLSNNDQYSTGNALMSRLNYSLKDKYLFTGTWRRDGYSAFGQKNPHAEFQSAALGWRMSEESFFNINWIDQLKLRVSWGTNGNRAIGRYQALARLATTQYLYGTTLATGVYTNTMANSDLRWERTEALNFGIDFGLFKNIYGSVEYYDMTTRDLLLNRSLPRIIGYSSVMANLGELGNKGFELSINSKNIDKENLKWNSTLTFSLNRNKIKHLYGEMVDIVDDNGNIIGQKEADDIANEWFIGQALDRIWDYEILGVWQLDETEQAAVYGKRPGDMKLRDVNNDGVLNPTDDKVFQGYKTPKYRLGLRNDWTVFKNFTISAFIRADLGFYGINNLYLNGEKNNIYERANRLYTEYWMPDNPTNKYGRLNSEVQTPKFNYWENRSFVRLQDLSVAYNIPQNKLKKYQIQNLRIYMSFRNLLTLTKWKHYDPESQTDMMPKNSSIGIDLTF